MQAFVGIDVSKDKLDVCLLMEGKKPRHKTFSNQPSGFQALLDWTERHAAGCDLHFCLEATGCYSTGVATFLAEAEETVSVVNPYRVKHAGISQGAGNKTDHADARLLADYCRKENPPAWRLCAPEARVLMALMRRLETMEVQKSREENRLEDKNLPKQVVASIKNSVRFYEREIKKLESQIEDHVNKNPGLKEDRDLLTTIPGIGEKLAQWILAEMPAMSGFDSAQQAAAFVGLAPREYQSGSSVKRRSHITKAGSGRLRHWLFMPAQCACVHNPLVKALYERLLARGMTKKAAVVAGMRKLLMLAYGVLTSRQTFQPDYHETRRSPKLQTT